MVRFRRMNWRLINWRRTNCCYLMFQYKYTAHSLCLCILTRSHTIRWTNCEDLISRKSTSWHIKQTNIRYGCERTRCSKNVNGPNSLDFTVFSRIWAACCTSLFMLWLLFCTIVPFVARFQEEIQYKIETNVIISHSHVVFMCVCIWLCVRVYSILRLFFFVRSVGLCVRLHLFVDVTHLVLFQMLHVWVSFSLWFPARHQYY